MKSIVYLAILCFCVFAFISCNTKSEKNYQPTGKERFEFVDPTHSGIDFVNLVKDSKKVNYFNTNYLYIGGGVGVGDFNNDGLVDLYFVSVTGENKLYFNKGNLQFEDVTAKAGIGLPSGVKTGVSLVDINADGWLDIYQCRTGQVPSERGNKLFINKGDGTFNEESAEYGLNISYPSTHASFFDFDLDGDLDMYLINRPVDYSTNSAVFVEMVDGSPKRINAAKDDLESDRLFLNNGTGKGFTDVSKKAGIWNRAFSLSVTILDVNEDGYPDIYIGNDYLEPDNLYVNQKNGTFKDELDKYMRHTSHFTMGTDIADINNDGLMDIVTLDMMPADNYRQKQNETAMKLERYNQLVTAGYGHQIMRNMLQLNNGNGGFNEVACLAGMHHTDWSWAPLLADFDNDGFKDLFVSNGMKKDVGDLDFANYTLDSLLNAPNPITDSSLLVNHIPSKKLSNYLFRNTGNLQMQDVTQEWGLGHESFSNGAVYADLDNDGDLDIVVHNTDDAANIYKNKTAEQGGANYLKIRILGPSANPASIGATVKITTSDGIQVVEKQLNRGFFSSLNQDLHFGLGSQNKVGTVEVVWTDKKKMTLQNVAANQLLTIDHKQANETWLRPNLADPYCAEVSNSIGISYLHVDNLYSDFERERLIPQEFSNKNPCLATGDVNSDGLEDFFVGGSFAKKGEIFIQQSNGKFRSSPQPSLAAEGVREDVDAVFFDANGDKILDLYIVSGGVEAPEGKGFYQDRLYMNDGKGNFTLQASALPVIDNSGSCVAVFDFDGDGDLDVARGGNVLPGNFPKVSRSFLLLNNGGKFIDATLSVSKGFEYIGMANAIHFEDLNKDGKAEMLVTGYWMPIMVFEKTPQGYTNVTAKFGLEGTEGWWNCLKTGDFNGDGFMDIVAGNLGLNCRLKASPIEPIEVFGLDIDHNGTIDPILSHYIGGKRYPLVKRDNLLKQVPSLKKNFTNYRSFSNAVLEDLITAEQQKNCIHLSAKIMANSVFLGSASGAFTRQDMPDFAQTAPMMDIAVDDLNKDGIVDMIAVGNNFGLEVESARLDAGDGWILFGSKEKGLTVVPNVISGFYASKEGRKLRLIKIGASKMPLILVANNHDSMQAFAWKEGVYQ